MNVRSVLLLYGLDEQTLPVDAECTRETIQRARAALSSRGWDVELFRVSTDLPQSLASYSPDDWIIFNLCEGSPSQPFYYARVAQVLEQEGYAFTGSGSLALEQTQFKGSMKRLLAEGDVPSPRWSVTDRPEDLRFDIFPAIIKPESEHCSFGITPESVVFDLPQAKKQAAKLLQQYGGTALVEEFLDSEEYGIALWGEDSKLEILGISVITYEGLPDIRQRLCTFDAKWL